MERLKDKSLGLVSTAVLLFILCVCAYYIRARQDPNTHVNESYMQSPEVSPSFPPLDITERPTPVIVSSADGTTYTNATHKFTFTYPPSLKAKISEDYAIDLFDNSVNIDDIINPQDIKLTILVNPDSHNFERVYTASNNSVIPEEAHAQDAVFTKVRNRAVDGYTAVDYTYDVPGHGTEKFFTKGTIINRNGTIIEISSWNSELLDMEQIIQTIHFFN